jgi:methyltransferase
VIAWLAFVGLVGLERLAELVVARRNARWSFERGAVEHGREHYPAMVTLHAFLLVGCALEPLLFDRPFLPWLGIPALALVLMAQSLRWWVIRTLGPRWNTRILVIPGGERIGRGPFRWLRHPNYLAVALEGAALPLVHSCWITALTFTLLDAAILRVRIEAEDRALRALAPPGG